MLDVSTLRVVAAYITPLSLSWDKMNILFQLNENSIAYDNSWLAGSPTWKVDLFLHQITKMLISVVEINSVFLYYTGCLDSVVLLQWVRFINLAF